MVKYSKTLRAKNFIYWRNQSLKNLRSVPVSVLLRNPKLIPQKQGIYIMFRETDGYPYVGESVNVSRRLIQHATPGFSKQYIDMSIKKDGVDKFHCAFLESTEGMSTEKRRKVEAKYVKLFNAYHLGFNGSKDGNPKNKFQRSLTKNGKKLRRKLFPEFNKALKEYQQYKGASKLKKYSKYLKRINNK